MQGESPAIVEMVDIVQQAGKLTDRDEMLQATLERESTRTTGIGNGMAIPHGKSSAVGELVMAMGIAAEPIDFESVDGKPVGIVIFLASPPDQTGPHIQALARISRAMTNPKLRKALNVAATAEEIYKLVEESDSKDAS